MFLHAPLYGLKCQIGTVLDITEKSSYSHHVESSRQPYACWPHYEGTVYPIFLVLIAYLIVEFCGKQTSGCLFKVLGCCAYLYVQCEH